LVSFAEIERYIVRKQSLKTSAKMMSSKSPVTLQGHARQNHRIDKAKGEVTLELLEATFTLPITVHSDYVKLVEKGKGSQE
jgi:hypothetical protein